VTNQLSPLRSGRITGSRVGAILGVKKGTTPQDVMREMVRDHFGDSVEFVGNAMTEYGNLMEEPARAEYERLTGNLVTDAQDFIIHPEHDFLGYSPDGLIGDDGLFEAKVPSQWAKWSKVADKPEYEAQLQHGLACSGRSWAHFFVYTVGGNSAPEMVRRDDGWLERNLPALAAFHAEFQRVIADPALAAPFRSDLVELLTDPESVLDEAELLQIMAAKEDLDAREAAIRARLTERAAASQSKTVRGRWFQVTKVQGRKSVKYADALKVLAPTADLTPFTEAGKASFRITRVKEGAE
jgi:predicted phage-related endonuclease